MLTEQQLRDVLGFRQVEDLGLYAYPGLTYYRHPNTGEVVVRDATHLFFIIGPDRSLIPAESLEELEERLDKLRT